uniref:Uncharacterized protein n=1 Tax=Siphoviridae sp. cttG313 TaxID=2825704 RepID=A0A8S5TS90_9CAUD|nr:MAG TPA: hypothetical protein [Siphoviridae sp. cttG313]
MIFCKFIDYHLAFCYNQITKYLFSICNAFTLLCICVTL